MSSPGFQQQYDRGAYLRGVLQKRWEETFDRTRRGSDRVRLARINRLADSYRQMDQVTMRERVGEWQAAVRSGKTPHIAYLEDAFAMLREVSRRTTGLFHYDEQVLGGLALVRGAVAEMATGEGKTLAVSLPCFLFSLAGEGVHVVTVNSYLAARDYEFSRPIFDYLGIGIALLPERCTPEEKRRAYAREITYGVGYEFGFDYMRDQLAIMRHPHSGPGEELRLAILGREKPEPRVAQRGLPFAIIDEVDSVLIDEAGSPLLISEESSAEASDEPFLVARDEAEGLIEEEHYLLNLQRRSVELTALGRHTIFRDNDRIPWKRLRRPWETYILNALRARHLFRRDEHYVVEDDAVIIVDEFTGRRFEDRSWREGQHQAVEAREGVKIRPEQDSAASITRQRFFALYDVICGLTGTAAESAGEFWRFFRMPVSVIPLHRPSRRVVHPERVFRDHDAMDAAIVARVGEIHSRGQPLLVGTRTIRDSERLSARLTEAGLPHRVLSAKQDSEEEAIVARAGESGSVLIATNMAGRGTHIGLSKEAEEAGGLFVIQVERNESVRIDRQLIGRGARQGQPGEGQAFVSADDYLIRTYAPEVRNQLQRARVRENGELSGSWSRSFDRVQAAVERRRYEMRIKMAEHDLWQEDTRESLSS